MLCVAVLFGFVFFKRVFLTARLIESPVSDRNQASTVHAVFNEVLGRLEHLLTTAAPAWVGAWVHVLLILNVVNKTQVSFQNI